MLGNNNPVRPAIGKPANRTFGEIFSQLPSGVSQPLLIFFDQNVEMEVAMFS